MFEKSAENEMNELHVNGANKKKVLNQKFSVGKLICVAVNLKER